MKDPVMLGVELTLQLYEGTEIPANIEELIKKAIKDCLKDSVVECTIDDVQVV